MTNLNIKSASKKIDLMPILRSTLSDSIECYGDFVSAVETKLYQITKEMIRSSNYFQEQSEDQITFHIISHFKGWGFGARHDVMIGGHVDISIEYEDYLWLAEAKIHKDYMNLQRGWEQLNSRYSTGMKDEDRGAFLIYNFNTDALNVTNEWRSRLKEFYPDLNIAPYDEQDLDFRTVGKHVKSGRDYFVTHYNIPLHFDPKDRNM